MAFKLFNTLKREQELFEPINAPHVGLYTCGPTVYDYPHIGNWRAYIFADLLKRYLIYRGYSVKHIMNITDVEDKIIKALHDKNQSLVSLTEFYTNEFYKDRDLLNILKADVYTKATSYIGEMIALIETLIQKDCAYRTDDGSIYFNIAKNKNYGKLSHFKISDLKHNAKGRLSNDEYEKENAEDFALWKAWSEEDSGVYWDPKILLGRETLLGKGRPGWHIECSAMSMKNLGESFDLHTGGVDNIFPHHENEIAQSESATGKPFVKYFMHNEHLMVNGEKMSKSLGNFYTLENLIERGVDPIAFRYWLYTSNYKTKTNFTLEAVTGAETALNRLREALLALGNDMGNIDENYKTRFMEFLDNDLDSPKAIALVWELLKDDGISDANKKITILDFDKVFGFELDKIEETKSKEENIPQEIIMLAEQREESRRNKDWAKSDELRKQIENEGYEIIDSVDGYKIYKK